MVTGWKRGLVSITTQPPWAERVSWRRVRGVVRSPWGVFLQDTDRQNAWGAPMRWNLTHTVSGRHVARCRTLRVAVAVAADLERTGIDWSIVTIDRDDYGNLDKETGAQRSSAVLARWASEGDVYLTNGARKWACLAAGLPVFAVDAS